jgi:hypothetical protein
MNGSISNLLVSYIKLYGTGLHLQLPYVATFSSKRIDNSVHDIVMVQSKPIDFKVVSLQPI